MNCAAVITAKRFTHAKQRLAGSVDEALRLELVAAMLADVLASVAGSRIVSVTIVVTGEPVAAELARQTGAEVVGDREDTSHSVAAVTGVDRAVELGADCVVLLPGDCPLLDPRELDRLLTGLPDPFVAIVPDRHGTGTNALVLVPPKVIRPAFGEGSCERHQLIAREAGVPFAVEQVSSLSLDLDTPADIVALTTSLDLKGGHAVNTARVLGI
ncbi:MAG: 2-phospho-L-lactate guanylyltransferase [Solirubrobacterales bacterium]